MQLKTKFVVSILKANEERSELYDLSQRKSDSGTTKPDELGYYYVVYKGQFVSRSKDLKT